MVSAMCSPCCSHYPMANLDDRWHEFESTKHMLLLMVAYNHHMTFLTESKSKTSIEWPSDELLTMKETWEHKILTRRYSGWCSHGMLHKIKSKLLHCMQPRSLMSQWRSLHVISFSCCCGWSVCRRQCYILWKNTYILHNNICIFLTNVMTMISPDYGSDQSWLRQWSVLTIWQWSVLTMAVISPDYMAMISPD